MTSAFRLSCAFPVITLVRGSLSGVLRFFSSLFNNLVRVFCRILPGNRRLLEMPMEDAVALAASRIPEPRTIICNQGSSESRFLTARLSPTGAVKSGQQAGPSVHEEVGQVYFSDDVSLEAFFKHLQKMVVG